MCEDDIVDYLDRWFTIDQYIKNIRNFNDDIL